MIGSLSGQVGYKSVPYCVIDVNGVGYELETSMTSFYQLPDLGAKVFLHTHLQVRDDQQCLYGFLERDERNLFRLLIKSSGVGPKLALAILSSMSTTEFVSAIRSEDTTSLVNLPGIGKKTAQRLVIDMRDRLKDWLQPITDTEDSQLDNNGKLSASHIEKEATSALIALGYKPTEASRMIHRVRDEAESCEQLIRLALQGKVDK